MAISTMHNQIVMGSIPPGNDLPLANVSKSLEVIPGLVVALILVHDLSAKIKWPLCSLKLFKSTTKLFQPFLSVHDISSNEDRTTCKIPSWKSRLLLALSCVVICSDVTLLAFKLASSQSLTYQDVLPIASWTYTTLRIWLDPPCQVSFLLLCFYLVSLLSGGSKIAHDSAVQISYIKNIYVLQTALSAGLTYIIGTYPLSHFLPNRNVANSGDAPSSRNTTPEDSASLWQWCSFSFVQSLLKAASTHKLKKEDIWMLSPFSQQKYLFEKYLLYKEKYPNHSLLKFLVTSNILDLGVDLAAQLFSISTAFFQTYCLQHILSILSDPLGNRTEVYFYALLAFVAKVSDVQVSLFQNWHIDRCYQAVQGQLWCLIHHKALLRYDSHKEQGSEYGKENRKPADLAKILNFMQGDTGMIALRFKDTMKLATQAIQLVVAIFYLYRILGWSCMTAVAVMLGTHMLKRPFEKQNAKLNRIITGERDAWLRAVNEIFQNIQFLKFYAWENKWAAKASNKRDKELQTQKKWNLIRMLVLLISTCALSLISFFTFASYTLLFGGHLTISKTFTALALFRKLQGSILFLLARSSTIQNSKMSFDRINCYLQEDEVPNWVSSLKPNDATPSGKLGFLEATFEWEKNQIQDSQAKFRLGPLDIDFPLQKISLVVGATGAGKSALLLALLGEMYSTGGQVMINKDNHNVAYCSQKPWLQHMTIRQNIIFGSPRGFDEGRYSSVVKACALENDFGVLDAGDLTEIGEKGVVLSGGQRARVALARAVYSEANVILLDDPLAAVDMHTAQHIMQQCLLGDLMQKRTIILVTHHVSLCAPHAAFFVRLRNGCIIEKGLPQTNLLKKNESMGEASEDTGTSMDSGNKIAELEKHTVANIPEKQANSHKPRLSESGKLVEEEKRTQGHVSIKTYLKYLELSGWGRFLTTIAFLVLLRINNIINNVFHSEWASAYPTDHDLNSAIFDKSYLHSLPPPNLNVVPWLSIYAFIQLTAALLSMFSTSLGQYSGLHMSQKMFDQLLKHLIHAPYRFFNVTPTGRILNRFTSDMRCIDSSLEFSLRGSMHSWLEFLTSLFFILWFVPSLTPLAVIISCLYVLHGTSYLKAVGDVEELTKTSKPAIYSGFDELMRGVTHIRAFGMESYFQEVFYRRVDTSQSCVHARTLIDGWLEWRYGYFGALVDFTTTLSVLWLGKSSGLAAIIMAQAGSFSNASASLVKATTRLELDFYSVERICEYLEVSQEAPSIIKESRPPAYWPSANGTLSVENLSVRYAPELPLILDKISFCAKPGEKIGIVGRTGSGKSTLAAALLRILEPCEGAIILDGINISEIGLEDLRSKITIVSQDVSLFSGTVRSNLDPFDEHDDNECWDVLERCHLTNRSREAQQAGSIDLKLDTIVSSAGSLSAGEQQLVALARALLRKSQVIILDEATSQIEVALDDMIQRTIREELSHSLVLTIAHRLKTIIDYDRIMVLGKGGQILEIDTPKNLLEKRGAFWDMCQSSADWVELSKFAKNNSSH